MTALAVTSITNFILAAEVFFLAGLMFGRRPASRSAAWFWSLAMLFVGLSALLGGIDHGFFEIHGDTPIRNVIEHSNWILIGLVTLWAFLTTLYQFVPERWQKTLLSVAGAQFAIYVVVSILIDNFLVVLVNYAPVMLFLLAMSFRGLTDGSGSWAFIIGISLLFVASGVQAAGLDVFSPFDRNSLYHFGMMAAVVFLYRGGVKLKGIL
jgi:hypothetical protein